MFFFDHNVSHKLAAMLRVLDVEVVALREQFPEDAQDVDWLPKAGQEGWIVLTGDDRIRTRPAERAALLQHRVTALFLPKTFQDKGKWGQAEWIIRHWPDIEKQVFALRPATLSRITDRGKVEPIHR